MRPVLSILMCLLTTMACAQSGIVYPDVFSTYFFNRALVNPSYVPDEGNVELMAAYKFRQGLYSDIATFAANGQKVWRKEGKPESVLRLIFMNEREGPYIASPKAYSNYAIKLPVASDVRLMAGISLGWSGMNFSAPSGAGSIMLLDGGVGIGLKYKKIHIGASSLQAFNSEGVVINSRIRLQRFYNVDLSAETAINPNLDVKGWFLWRYLPSLPDQFNVASSVQYQKKYEVGALYFHPRGVSYFSSITLNPEENSLFISFAYNSSLLSSNPVWGKSFEIGLRYRMK